jgi:hypothetical protein
MKFYTITREQVQAMIDDVNESITAVTPFTVVEVATAIQDSLTADCVWSNTDADVTFGSLIACVEEWLSDRNETVAPAEPAPLPTVSLDVFPVRIRSEAQVADIHHAYRVGITMAEAVKPDATVLANAIATWEAKGDDQCLAFAQAWRTYQSREVTA